MGTRLYMAARLSGSTCRRIATGQRSCHQPGSNRRTLV
ncbi:hypothetical protein CSC41_4736 [Pseudomonas aeruginosa]|nr:hypothetical protein CSC41_4736 [Pseudomonas aeruginosa]